MKLKFTCKNCKASGLAELSGETPFVHAPWYMDYRGLQHNCIYCRSCGAVHDTVMSLLGVIKMQFRRIPSKVVALFKTQSIKRLTVIKNPNIPDLRSLNPVIITAMKEDGRLKDDDLTKEPTADFLIECLSDDNPIVKREAIIALKGFSDKRAVEPLIEALKDTRWDVRMNAAITLGHLGDTKATEPLSELVVKEMRRPLVQREAMIALEKIQKSKRRE